VQRGGDDRPNVNPTPNTNGNQNSQNGNSSNNQSKPSTPSNPGTPSQPANPSKPATPSKPSTPSTPSKPSNPTAPSKPSTPSTPSKPNTSASAQGGNAYDITGLSAYLNSATKTNISGDKDFVITIGNHKITVVRPGITAGKLLKVLDQKGNMTVSGDILSYVRFGTATVFTSSGAEEKTYEFAYGKLTAANDVPASGKATYKGYVHTETALAGYLNASLFNVDFCKKTIDGKIYDASDVAPSKAYVALSGKISGNSFSGTKGAVEMQGNFYGPKAAELGGIFKGQTDYGENNGNYLGIVGSFGAKKQ
jgi:putative lipoprotein